jgi:hypothetical protein
MRLQFILVTGFLLANCAPGWAQTLTAEAFVAQAHLGSPMMLAPARFALNASREALLPEKPEPQLTAATPPVLIARGHDDGSFFSRLPIEDTKTPFVTASGVGVLKFWQGRLELGGFESTVHMRSVEFGPPVSRSLPLNHDQAALGSSFSGDGVRLVLRLGRVARTTHEPQPWRLLLRDAFGN